MVDCQSSHFDLCKKEVYVFVSLKVEKILTEPSLQFFNFSFMEFLLSTVAEQSAKTHSQSHVENDECQPENPWLHLETKFALFEIHDCWMD